MKKIKKIKIGNKKKKEYLVCRKSNKKLSKSVLDKIKINRPMPIREKYLNQFLDIIFINNTLEKTYFFNKKIKERPNGILIVLSSQHKKFNKGLNEISILFFL